MKVVKTKLMALHPHLQVYMYEKIFTNQSFA